MEVCIIGTGYVGLATGTCLAYLGHKVTCIDTDAAKIACLQGGNTPIYEPHLQGLLAATKHALEFTPEYESIAAADVVFIAVGTPPTPDGSPDLRYLRAAAEGIGQHYRGNFIVVVNKSTVPIGSGNWVESIVRDCLRSATTGARPRACSPLRPTRNSFAKVRRSSIGFTRTAWWSAPTTSVPRKSYTRCTGRSWTRRFTAPPFLPRPDRMGAVPLISTDLASAELIKYAANAFLALKISYINEIGQLADKVGADITQVANGIGLDARIGTRFLQAGIGWGGSCFGKDTAALVATACEYGLQMPIVKAARDVNRRQRERVVEKLLDELKILKGRTIGSARPGVQAAHRRPARSSRRSTSPAS